MFLFIPRFVMISMLWGFSLFLQWGQRAKSSIYKGWTEVIPTSFLGSPGLPLDAMFIGLQEKTPGGVGA